MTKRFMSITVLALFFVLGCFGEETAQAEKKEEKKDVNAGCPVVQIGGIPFYVVRQGRCQYFWRKYGDGADGFCVVFHKGDCDNPIHYGLEKDDKIVEEKLNEPIILETGKVKVLKLPEGHSLSVRYEENGVIIVEAIKK